jgi:hypothetical protein
VDEDVQNARSIRDLGAVDHQCAIRDVQKDDQLCFVRAAGRIHEVVQHLFLLVLSVTSVGCVVDVGMIILNFQ